MRRTIGRLGFAAAAVALASFGVAACGGGDNTTSTTTSGGAPPQQAPFTDDRDGLATPSSATDSANRRPRGASVTYNDPPPPIAAAVKAAAAAAGCTVASWPSEADPAQHMECEATAAISVPPLSGAHNGRWADWGVYNEPVPYKYLLHNLEHGGVFVHYGREVPVAGVNAIREWWAKTPAFIVVAPNTAPQFPATAVVAGSQQRWLVCRGFSPAMINAVDAFAKEYRGRGPEQTLAQNAEGDRPDDLPEPAIPDKGA